MTKHAVGDKVKVRSDLELDRAYYMEDNPAVRNSFVSDMKEVEGMIVTIKGIVRGQYEIEECDFLWTDGMFEPAKIDIDKKLSGEK